MSARNSAGSCGGARHPDRGAVESMARPSRNRWPVQGRFDGPSTLHRFLSPVWSTVADPGRRPPRLRCARQSLVSVRPAVLAPGGAGSRRGQRGTAAGHRRGRCSLGFALASRPAVSCADASAGRQRPSMPVRSPPAGRLAAGFGPRAPARRRWPAPGAPRRPHSALDPPLGAVSRVITGSPWPAQRRSAPFGRPIRGDRAPIRRAAAPSWRPGAACSAVVRPAGGPTNRPSAGRRRDRPGTPGTPPPPPASVPGTPLRRGTHRRARGRQLVQGPQPKLDFRNEK